jgi:hypothetical protein
MAAANHAGQCAAFFARQSFSVAWANGSSEFSGVPEIGKLLVVFGAGIALIGLALWSGFGAGWLGRLPGDIRIERNGSGFYFLIVTCIILSIGLSLILSLFRR